MVLSFWVFPVFPVAWRGGKKTSKKATELHAAVGCGFSMIQPQEGTKGCVNGP